MGPKNIKELEQKIYQINFLNQKIKDNQILINSLFIEVSNIVQDTLTNPELNVSLTIAHDIISVNVNGKSLYFNADDFEACTAAIIGLS